MRYAALLTLAAVATVSAQRVERTLDLHALGWGRLDRPQMVETDGNLATTEWLVRSLDTEQFRVVTESPFCAGAWFDPRPTPFHVAYLERDGLRHKLALAHAFDLSAPVLIVSLDTPTCP